VTGSAPRRPQRLASTRSTVRASADERYGFQSDAAAARRDALVERLFLATVGTWDVLAVHRRPPRALPDPCRAAGNLCVIVGDERVPDEFDPPGDEVERFYYGFSILHCLPVGMIGEGAAGTGTVMRAGTMRRYAEDAGFGDIEVLPIENDFYRFYRLTP